MGYEHTGVRRRRPPFRLAPHVATLLGDGREFVALGLHATLHTKTRGVPALHASRLSSCISRRVGRG